VKQVVSAQCYSSLPHLSHLSTFSHVRHFWGVSRTHLPATKQSSVVQSSLSCTLGRVGLEHNCTGAEVNKTVAITQRGRHNFAATMDHTSWGIVRNATLAFKPSLTVGFVGFLPALITRRCISLMTTFKIGMLHCLPINASHIWNSSFNGLAPTHAPMCREPLELPPNPQTLPCGHVSGTLPRFLRAYQSDDPTELRRLGGMFLDDALVDAVHLAQLRTRLQHSVLQLQHLLQRVVEEGSREGNGVCRAAVEPHIQLPRPPLLLFRRRLCLLGLRSDEVLISSSYRCHLPPVPPTSLQK